MSVNFKHLSKSGARIMDRLTNPPKGIVKHQAKIQAKSLPSFLKPDLPIVKEAERYKNVREWRFLPGDRVVVMKGECRGNVAYITKHDDATNGYILDENGPTKTVAVPKDFWTEGQTTHLVNIPKLMQKQDLRLVADIEDPKNPGTTKTVAVDHITFKGKYYDENYKKMMPYRCVFGQTDLVIPWPKPEAIEDGELSTDSAVAREQTYWVDSIVRNTIPEAAFQTIRNPHSKFRRGKITVSDIKKLVAPEMPLSDTKKAYLAEQAILAERTVPELTEEDKALIGERVKKLMDADKLNAI